jgi:hypothetical protein
MADRCSLIIHFGDGDSTVASRVNGPTSVCAAANDGVLIGDNTRLNIYDAIHTYPGNGSYVITVEDPNRNAGICNIPNSVNTSFFLHTQLFIDPTVTSNNSVQFLLPPIFHAITGTSYNHNVTAYDPDGDILTYEFIPCKAGQQNIPGYSIPAGILINQLSGEITWNTPSVICQYSFAVKISEWRNGSLIGYVVRDFIINVSSSSTSYNFSGTSSWTVNNNGSFAYDLMEGDSLELELGYHSATSENLIVVSDAFMLPNPPVANVSNISTSYAASFQWNTNSVNARNSPYIITFRGTAFGFSSDVTLIICVHDSTSSGCCHIVGIKEYKEQQNKVLVYPNPANEIIVFSGELITNGSIVFIYDVTGKLIDSRVLSSTSCEINISQLNEGFYNYQIINTNSLIARGKFVKAK